MHPETFYSTLCDTTMLLRALRQISLDDSRLEALARGSYRHENGYYKLVLSSTGPQAPSVRMHIWDPPSSEPKPDIHSHAWEFRSRIVAGSLLNVIYDSIAGPGDGAEMFEYAVRNGDSYHTGHHLRCLGKTTLKETGRFYLPIGTQYGFGTEIIHQVSPGSMGAISVFLQMPFKRDESRLFRIREQRVASVCVPLLSTCEIVEIIEKAMVRITSQAVGDGKDRQP